MMVTKFLHHISRKLTAEVAIFPLATFRVVLGGLLLFSTLRFWYYGWIEDFYLAPTYFFSYFGQEWIQPYGESFIYTLFILMAVSALGILLGLFFRASSLLFFLSFTYVELIDKTTYLNHYYFVSLMVFLLMLTPAHRALSLDSKLFPSIRSYSVPRWSILALQFQIAILYFFAGVAKLNYDWLFKAQPMSLWLKSKTELPVLGEVFSWAETAFIFSWAGMLFDISIAFILFSKKLRPFGYAAVVAFHILTWLLFPIGVFPWVMIGVTLVFFSSEWHERSWARLNNLWFIIPSSVSMAGKIDHNLVTTEYYKRTISNHKLSTINFSLLVLLGLHFIIQLALPMRHTLNDDNLYWTENGYRFSWRVMLMEKTGHLEFRVKDVTTQKESLIELSSYFTAFQQRQIVTQPDMILQAAKIIEQDYVKRGIQVEVYAESYASLNGIKHRPFVNPEVNLASSKKDLNKDWIIQYD